MFTPDQLERYSRHFILKEIGVSGQKKLQKSSVLVVGAGALGSPALMYLAAARVLGAAVGVLSSIQATEAIKYILGIGDLLVGRMVIFDGLHMQFNEAKFPKKMTGCAVCSENHSIKSLEENRAEYEVKGCEY